jgi:hypothetical protein
MSDGYTDTLDSSYGEVLVNDSSEIFKPGLLGNLRFDILDTKDKIKYQE